MFGTTGGLRTERGALRPIHKAIIKINTELGQVHKSLNLKIDVETYTYATEFTQ